jgi:hypothetical protein
MASSEHPAPGFAQAELTYDDMEGLLSNRDRIYGGWDEALKALAHDIDPDGSLGISHGPPPVPVDKTVTLKEGRLSALLVDQRNTKGIDIGSTVVQLGITIARANRYGEPSFGIRKVATQAARFLMDMGAAIPPQQDGASHAGRIRGAAIGARYNVAVQIGAAQPQAVQRLPRDFTGFVPDPPKGPLVPNLDLDVLDIANAWLGVLIATDEHGNETRVRILTGKTDELFGRSLLAAAFGRPEFGGPAPPGSRWYVVACRAFATLVALGKVGSPNGNVIREAVLQTFEDSSFAPDAYSVYQTLASRRPFITAIQAAMVTNGVADAAEAKSLVTRLIKHSFRTQYYPPDPVPTQGPHWPAAPESILTLKVLQGASGMVNHDAIVAELQQAVSELRPVYDTYQLLVSHWQENCGPPETWRDVPKKSDLHASLPKKTNPCLATDVRHQAGFTILWLQDDSAALNNPATKGLFCAPSNATPRILLVAKGALHDFVIDKIYIGVPTAILVVFDAPYDGAAYPVSIKLGGSKVELSAKPIDDERLVFETQNFVPVR